MKVLLFLLLLSFSVQAKDIKLKFKMCDEDDRKSLTTATEMALESIDQISEKLDEALQFALYSDEDLYKLKKAKQKISCIKRKLPRNYFRCLNLMNVTYYGYVLKFFGRRITIDPLKFGHNTYWLSVAVAHETSHRCGTNDKFYTELSMKSLNPHANKRWYKTASLYGTWIRDGFCVPGQDCPDEYH